MKQTARLFIAAEVTPAQMEELDALAKRLRKAMPGNYVHRQNYHITLAFLGETPLALTEEIGRMIEQSVRENALGPVGLACPGFFGKPHNAILWCGLFDTQPLVQLGEHLRKSLRESGIRFDEKPIRPHITLARKVDVRGLDFGAYTPRPLAALSPAITLYESTRVHGVLTYIPLFRAKI